MKMSLLVLLASILLTSCAFPQATVPQRFDRGISAVRADLGELSQGAAAPVEAPRMTVTNAPVPELGSATQAQGQAGNVGPGASESIVVNIDQMTIKSFVQFVFGNLLKKTVALDAKIEQRTDLITIRTDNPQTARQIADTAKLLLQGYGVSVTEFDSLVRVTSADNRSAELPLLRRGRASAETPSALRPVFHLVELEATRSTEMINWLKLMFGQRVEFQDDQVRNSILVSGAPENVVAALEIVRVLDQPRMRGRISKRITPGYLTATELVTRLTEILTAQGYAVSGQASTGPFSAIMLVPVTNLNTVFLFTASQSAAEHVVRWAAEIDQPPPSAAANSFVSFPVRYSDAQSLAKTMTELIAAGAATTVAAAAPGSPQSPPVARPPSRVVVNGATNSLIIQGGSPEEQRQWRSLLAELDKPVKSALIDVVVAEVTLGAKEQLGIEWGGSGSVSSGTLSGGTLGGLGLGTAGLTLAFLNNPGSLRAALNFLGSSSDAKVLSSPKLLARNAETASITVGQEVPIVTSQQSTNTTASPGGTPTGVLQTIQYRSTGVILRVKPIILAGGRLDLELTQEVSSASQTTTGVTTSPTISTRRVETKLSLRDGGTVMIAGLISETGSVGNSGIPGLKNLPAVGALFRNQNKSRDKTELIILITAHILNDDFEAESITEGFRRSMSPWLNGLSDGASGVSERGTVGGMRLQPNAMTYQRDAPGSNAVADPAQAPPLPARLGAPISVPRQPDSTVVEVPSGASQSPRPPLAAVPGQAPAAAPVSRIETPRAVIQGTPVTDPKLLEELNKGLRK